MFSPRCTASPRCVRSPVPLEELGVHWDGEAVGRKAVSKPSTREMWLERSWWGSQRYADGRLVIFCHEWAHIEGARCETCADWGAGVLMRELGSPTSRDALRTLYAALDNRSPDAAMREVKEGHQLQQLDAASAYRWPQLEELELGLEGDDPLSSKARKAVEAYRAGKPFGLWVYEVEPGRWLSEAAGRSYLRAKAKAAAAGVTGKLRSAWRSMSEQVTLDSGDRAQYAAEPGKSPHQRGVSGDIESSTETMRERFIDFLVAEGWKRNASEAWHVDYVGPGTIPVSGALPAGAAAPLPEGGALVVVAGAGGLLVLAGLLAALS